MAFDIEGARAAGYSDDEIADFLGKDSGFDVAGAQKAGYAPAEIVAHLSSLKKPAAPAAATGRATDAEIDSTLNTPINSDVVNEAAPAKAGGVAAELANLRDSFFTGVDNTRASVKTVNMGMVANRLQKTTQRLKDLEARGEGESTTARQMRSEIASAKGQLPRAVGEMTEAQGDAQRGAAISTRPAVAKVGAAKTFGEAWEAFKEAPYDVIAGVTATSLPSTLPALVAAAVMGPGAGALAMGANSAAVEGGSALAEFARDAGVDVTNAKAVEGFFTNPQNLAAAMSYAGKRAGVIGALDAASGGLAGKTIAPAMKSQIARQAVNLPTQMGAQAALGAGGEAGAQLVTKGEIDQPGQVLMEAAGELGGAPMEVAAFGREARLAAREKSYADKYPTEPGTLPGVPPAPVDPVAAIGKAQTVDEAIAVAQAALQSSTAVDNIGDILKQNMPAGLINSAPAATENVAGLTPDVAQTTQAITELEAANVSPPPASPLTEAAALDEVPAGAAAGNAAQPAGPGALLEAVPAEPGAGALTESPNVQDQTPAGPAAQGQAAPAQTPEAGAAAGSPAAAAGTAPGDAAVQAAGVDQRLVPLSKRVKLDADPAATAKAEAVTGEQLDKQWTAFAPDSGTLSVPRAEMPQIKAEHRGAMVNFLNARDIAHTQEEVPATSLKPTQAEFSPSKVEKALSFTGPDRSILVSSDNHVLDGHHQWMSKLQAGEPVKIIRLDAPIKQLLETVKEFPSAEQARGATATQQRADFAASEKTRKVPGTAARTRANAENPFKAFLGKHGISNSLAAEFAPGRKERQAAMVQGYGPMFRKSGPLLDALAARAVEEGFLLTPDEAKLQALITDALRGKRIIPQYAQGVAEDEGMARAERAADLEQQDAEAQNAEVEAENQAERDAIQAVADLPDTALEFLSDADIVLTASNNVSEADFLRALGATEQEIEDATAKQSEGARQGDQGRAGAEETAASAAPGNPQGRDGQAGGGEGLSNADARNLSPRGEAAQGTAAETDGDGGRDAALRVQSAGPVVGEAGERGVSASGNGPERGPGLQGLDQGDAGTGADGAGSTTEGLTSPTPADVLAQQQRAADGYKADAKAATTAADRARADAELPEFTLTGSDRPADVAAAGGQQDIFADPVAETKATLDANNVTGKERLDVLKDVKTGVLTVDEVKEAYPTKIEDAGEKIGGARKDRWKDRGLNLSDLDSMSESEGAELATKANVWKPDYEALAEATEPVTAAMVKTVYDQLAAQPKKNTPEGRRNYVTMMQAVRKAYLDVKSPEDVKQAGAKLKSAIGIYSEDAATKAQAREVLFSVYKGRSDPFVLSYNELSKAKKLVDEGFPAKGEPWKKRLSLRAYSANGFTPRGLEITLQESAELGTPLTSEQVAAGFYRINTKDGKAVGYAPTKADAEAAAKTIYERDLKKGASDKAEPTRPNLDALKRENLPKRIDRDVSADDFVGDFGFRGVEFGNWAAQDERQRIINMAYDGLMDLAEIMGVPPKAMSLNATMGMAFGARGGGKFAAHYEPGKLVINMTKINGGGSMAHEWAHALDHYFGELNQKDAYTTKARGASGWYDEQQYKGVPQTRMERDAAGKWANVTKMRLDNMRPEMAKAFDDVMSALFSGQETKAQMVRSEELAIERYQALADKETDPETKAMYLRGIESRQQALEELRKDPEDKTYPKGRSQYASQAQALSGKSANGYWTRPTEMFARAFESWVFDKVTGMGARSDYLVHGVEEDRFAGGNYKGNPYPTGQERATINAAFDKLAATIQTKETDKGVMMFSRAAPGEERNALEAISRNDELFALPKSDQTTIEGIAADNAPGITVKKMNYPGLVTTYALTMPDGAKANIMVRKVNPYGEPQAYGMVNREDGEFEASTDRPGRSPENVPEDTEDVYIDVSNLKEGGQGRLVYNIAATFAHNTNRILIGDPAGLSNAAMRRRTEHMLSSALKFGTTRHLAPHPRQTLGAADIGVPPLRWTYGDDLGNIKSLIQVSTESLENAGGNPFTFDPATGTFRDSEGGAIDDDGISLVVEAGSGRTGKAGNTTLQRSAVLSALLREQSQEGGGTGSGVGLLGRLVAWGREHGVATNGIFYSEGSTPAGIRNPSTVERVQAAVAELIGGKQLPNKLGRVVATTASEIKSYWEPQIGQNVQLGSEGEAGQAQAFFDPRTKTVFLIADNIPAGDETAVAAHELMHKHGQAVLGVEGWDKLHSVINSWANAPEDSDERAVYTYARSRVEAVGLELSSQEMFPYAVEAAIKMGVKPSLIAKQGTVARWLGSVKYAMQQAWGKVTGKPETFKTQDLVDLAFGIAQMENPESAAAMGRITDAPVKTDSPEFERWFGESKVVDSDGNPQIVYHGTSASQDGEAFSSFDTYASNYGLMGMGGYFTADPAVASSYTTKGRGATPTVYPAYLSIKNPIDMEAPADVPAWEKQFDDIEQYHEGGDTNEAWYRAAESSIADQEIPMYEGAEIMQDGLRAMGFDGITHVGGGRVQKDGARHRVYVAFDPEQVKSATGNNGDFDGSNPDIRFSRTAIQTGTPATQPNLSPWRDETGRLQFAPGAWLYDQIGKAASPMLVRLGMKAATPELRRQLRQMKIDVEKAQEVAVAIARETTKLSEAERAMVSDLVEQELKVGVIPPAHAVKLAAMINDAMGRQTDELVSLGMLTKDSADKWRGKYLPRYYESKLKDKLAKAGATWADALMGLTGRQSVMKGIKGKNLKGRGLYETIPEAQLKDYEALGWEVRDPDYTPSLPTVDGTVQVWRDFSPAEREKMGEIRDAGFRFVMGYMQTQRDIALGRMFERMAQDPDSSSRLEKEGYVQVPTTVVSGTGAKVYGKLAGRWVPTETMSQLSNIEESTSAAWQMYRKAMAVWKMGKTAMNPVSHVNNIVSNLTMAHLAGVSYLRGDKYLAAARDFVKKTPMLQEAKDNGLFLGTLSDTELMNSMPEELRILAQKQESTTLKVARTGFDVMTMFLRKPMGAAYQAEDTFFRYLIYKDARERGTDPQDAVDYAQRYIFTYDDLPKGARRIRDFGIPFFSYTYKAAPALLHTALTHPLRMAAPAAVLWGINAAAYAIATGDDDDDWQDSLQKYITDPAFRAKAREQEKLEREHLPPWNKGTTALLTPKMIRLGMDEVTKLPLFIDVSRIIPGGDLFDISPNAGGIPLPQPITPSHPLFTTAVAMLGNKDLFRGKDLVDKNDTKGEAAEKRAAWMWTQLAPAVAAGSYHWERGMNALAQATGKEVTWMPDMLGGDATGIGRDGLPVQPKYAAMQTFGIKVRPMDLDTSAAIDKNMQNKLLRDIDAEMSALRRLERKGAVSPRAVDKARELADMKQDRIKQGLTVDGSERD